MFKPRKLLIKGFRSVRGYVTKKSHTNEINNFFKENPHIQDLVQYIPPKYLELSRKATAEHLYLLCTDTAKIIANHMITSLDSSGRQIVSETNAGLGLIATELLEQGVSRVRMYESCPDFRLELKNFGKVFPGRVELFTKDLFHLYRLAWVDKQDNCNRVESLLKNVPKRSWIDDPVLTVVGTMASLSFIKYLIRSVALQCIPSTYGRIQIFALIKPKDYNILAADSRKNLNVYQPLTILFNLLFDHEHLETFPRNIFLPWEYTKRKYNTAADIDSDKMYFVKMNLKKQLPVSVEHFLALYYFVKHFYGRGNNKIIPTIEKWVPGCGLNILVPSLKHKEYFQNIDIFTTFRELTPDQILSIFKEMLHNPSYQGSPFTAMIESELLKSETIETVMAEGMLERTIIEDVEEKLNFST